MNVVMLQPIGGGEAQYVEVQGTAEGVAFSRAQLDALLALAEGGLVEIGMLQGELIAEPPPVRAAR
jgi:ribonuclease PH